MNQRAPYVIFPIQHHNLWSLYKKSVSNFWTVEEVTLVQDIKDWKDKMTPDERRFIGYTLAFFAASDGIVNENLALRFLNDTYIIEAKCFYGMQIAIENIHAETYSLLIDTYVSDNEERNHLFNAIEHIPCVAKKAAWAKKWIDSDRSYGDRLVAFAAVEGIFFSGSFCSIYWLKKRALMPGLCFSNELISRDEGLHCQFACQMHAMLPSAAQSAAILDIIREAVDIELEFVTEALNVSLIGINAGMMCDYIQMCADLLLNMLGQQKHYNKANPFPWMEVIALQGKTNFFELRVGEYSRAQVSGSSEFISTADF
jgi:ribonucleotide reductase beta subunit family protein with ferritin-like domain